LKQVAFSAASTYYYDIWILATREEDTASLELWATDSEYADVTKCCWTTGLEIAKKLNGFARVIHYFDKENEGKQPTTAFQIWEGEVKDGKPYGFSRFISATSDYSFVGYMRNWFTTLNGTGLFFKESQLLHSGIYDDSAKIEDTPATIQELTEFVSYN